MGLFEQLLNSLFVGAEPFDKECLGIKKQYIKFFFGEEVPESANIARSVL